MFFRALCLIGLMTLTTNGYSQAQEDTTLQDLKKLSLEELMNMEVTSVSRRAEKLSEVASAIQVITNEDIRRSGATNLPDALRLAFNLQVAQVSAFSWTIGSRGFGGTLSNKLLVMIDGRTVYSPLFAGVFWDVQSVLLEDVERIEVISGPGGTLWGANAVNGVINIITKSATETQSLYVTGAAGTSLRDHGAIRFGGKIGENFSYRVYAQHIGFDSTLLPATATLERRPNGDAWELLQTGFRMDWSAGEKNSFTTLGNFYMGEARIIPSKSTVDGQNILGRWSHTFSENSNLTVQLYADRTWRHDKNSQISDQLETYDFDLQHRFKVGKRQNILWGTGYRFMHNVIVNRTSLVGILPNTKDMSLYSAFIQDEIMIVPDKFKLTIGTKLLHNVYSGFEVQPSARLTLTPTNNQTFWAACSRAVRTPSRIDVDYYAPTYAVPATVMQVAGGPNFVSEKLIAYELGYRIQPMDALLLSLAGFYNTYDDLASIEPLPNTQIYQFQNGVEGYSYGSEISFNYQVVKPWRIRGGYTYVYKKLTNKPGHNYDVNALGNDPAHTASLQSMLNLPGNFQLDLVGRYCDMRPSPLIPAFFTFDARLAWTYKKIELSVTGQNLWEYVHTEYGSLIPRSVYGRITCRF